jgi:hypothetical protein
MIDSTTLAAKEIDRSPSDGRVTDGGLALLEKELVALRKRCRARELALGSMAGAVNTLRRANRALNEENALLRQQISEQAQRASRRSMAHHPGLPATAVIDE